VSLFEASGGPGGHVNTVQVENQWIDTGFIVYNRPNYPIFCKLLDQLGIVGRPTRMSFGVWHEPSGRQYSTTGLFAQPSRLLDPGHWRLLRDIGRAMHNGAEWSDTPADISLEDAFAGQMSREFIDQFLKPICGALWSCPSGLVEGFPVRFAAAFLMNHGMLQLRGRPQWLTIPAGSKTYVERLLASTRVEVRFGEEVDSVGREATGIGLLTAKGRSTFDEVILACHGDDALCLNRQPTEAEREVLGTFAYQPNRAILHTDVSVLPPNRKAWASWNVRLSRESGQASVHYNMNFLQGLATTETYIVSLNAAELIEPRKIVASFDYRHPIPSTAAMASWARRREMVRHRGISYCGAYWGYGFHEDGARSAVEVCDSFGERL